VKRNAQIGPTKTVSNLLGRRQKWTLALLFFGYAAFYFCRSDLSVALPLIVAELQREGVSNHDAIIHMGQIASFGVLAYAVGKLLLTGLGDFWGGRRSFLVGLGGATIFTFLFASGSSPTMFLMAWIGNRLTQSIGWAGAVKVCSKWYNYTSYGTAIGILSLSYLIGDVVARQSMGTLLSWGHDWRALFYFAAGVAGLLLIANLLFLRESRVEFGYLEPQTNPLNLCEHANPKPRNLLELLRPLLLSRAFGVVCLLSLGCTIVRETFNIWTPVYLRDFFSYSVSAAARASAIFPAVGAVSVLLAGWVSDRLGASGRSMVMFLGLAATAVALLALTGLHPGLSKSATPLLLLGLVAFCFLGPYSYLAGAFALDFGGKQAGAASSGLIDGVGYLGGVVAGDSVARVSVAFGWGAVFMLLTGLTVLSALAAGYLYFHQRGLERSRAARHGLQEQPQAL
jgi:sugar phosphate permease